MFYQHNNDRTQSNTWLWDDDFPSMYNIAKRFDRMTRLQISNPAIQYRASNGIYQEAETSEAWQVQPLSPDFNQNLFAIIE